MEPSNNEGIMFSKHELGMFSLDNRMVLVCPGETCSQLCRHLCGTTEFDFAKATYITPELKFKGYVIITEPVVVSQDSRCSPYVPGIWNDEQVKEWQLINYALEEECNPHIKIFCQLVHYGSAHGKQPCLDEMVATYIMYPYAPRYIKPKEEDVATIIEDFRKAARKARDACFNGVEINAADGYLLGDFMKTDMYWLRDDYKREDAYGRKSLENRCRLALEVVEAVAKEIGRNRVGVKICPFDIECSDYRGSKDIAYYMCKQLNTFDIAYLRVPDNTDRLMLKEMRELFKNSFIVSGLVGESECNNAVDKFADLVGNVTDDFIVFGLF
ncbi:hypothetical protein ABFS83_14G166700 [Erythranthe nasuta]